MIKWCCYHYWCWISNSSIALHMQLSLACSIFDGCMLCISTNASYIMYMSIVLYVLSLGYDWWVMQKRRIFHLSISSIFTMHSLFEMANSFYYYKKCWTIEPWCTFDAVKLLHVLLHGIEELRFNNFLFCNDISKCIRNCRTKISLNFKFQSSNVDFVICFVVKILYAIRNHR